MSGVQCILFEYDLRSSAQWNDQKGDENTREKLPCWQLLYNTAMLLRGFHDVKLFQSLENKVR